MMCCYVVVLMGCSLYILLSTIFLLCCFTNKDVGRVKHLIHPITSPLQIPIFIFMSPFLHWRLSCLYPDLTCHWVGWDERGIGSRSGCDLPWPKRSYLLLFPSSGSEWKYVIVSTVRSCCRSMIDERPTKGWQKKHLGFVTDENQVNVAITRAQEGLCIIGTSLVCVSEIIDAIEKLLLGSREAFGYLSTPQCTGLAATCPGRECGLRTSWPEVELSLPRSKASSSFASVLASEWRLRLPIGGFLLCRESMSVSHTSPLSAYLAQGPRRMYFVLSRYLYTIIVNFKSGLAT